jgi:hypothetical protein
MDGILIIDSQSRTGDTEYKMKSNIFNYEIVRKEKNFGRIKYPECIYRGQVAKIAGTH